MEFTTAIVSPPPDTFTRGLSSAHLGEPDLARAKRQHAEYCLKLEKAGVGIVMIPADSAFPDGTFVEDTAVVTPETAVLARPGAEPRREEPGRIAGVLGEHRSVVRIESPGTMDGGDVLRMDRHVFVGLSGRTNRDGAGQLAVRLTGFNYALDFVELEKGLHLKSFVNRLDAETLLVTREYRDHPAFEKYRRLVVPEGESYAANCLSVNGSVLIAAGFPQTAAMVAEAGYSIMTVEMSEFQKMDGGLTCLSILF